MSRAPARRPAAAAPAEPHCPRNDDCQMRSTVALESIAAGLEQAMPAIKAAGQVFGRWESMCVWVRAKTPKHGWWLLLALWVFSNFVSPELKTAINEWMAVLIRQAAAGSGA